MKSGRRIFSYIACVLIIALLSSTPRIVPLAATSHAPSTGAVVAAIAAAMGILGFWFFRKH